MKIITKKEKHLLAILAGAEELIENLDMKGKDKKLGKVYKFIHGFNITHSCWGAHQSWREEFREWICDSKKSGGGIK